MTEADFRFRTGTPKAIPSRGMHDMLDNLPLGLRKATHLTGAGRLMEATAAIQRMLGSQTATPSAENPKNSSEPFTIDGVAERVEPVNANVIGRTPLLGKVNLRDLVRRKAGGASGSVAVPNGAQFLAATFTNDAGSRPYKLYVPSGYRAGQSVALIVMLHGCTQSPDDFAAGTRMNEVAEERNVLVVYPGQTGAANMQKCWNWFRESDQLRGAGEPSLIAGITREVMADYTVDPQRVLCGRAFSRGRGCSDHGQNLSRPVCRNRRALGACLRRRARYAICLNRDAPGLLRQHRCCRNPGADRSHYRFPWRPGHDGRSSQCRFRHCPGSRRCHAQDVSAGRHSSRWLYLQPIGAHGRERSVGD